MRHVSGRQPPHAAERSARLKKERAAPIQAAEHLADLVGRLARGAEVLPGETDRAGRPSEALRTAAEELASAAARWAAREQDPEAPVRILVTSGSEAEPKMIAYSHNAMAGGRANYVRGLADAAQEPGPMRALLLMSLMLLPPPSTTRCTPRAAPSWRPWPAITRSCS